MNGFTWYALSAVCICMGGLSAGVAIVLLVQWVINHQARTEKIKPQETKHENFPQPVGNSGWVIQTRGPNQGMSMVLDQPIMRIGRHPANDIQIDHPQISRFHARFTWDDTNMYLEDLGSMNGTYLNKTRLRTRTRLSNGDVIGLGEWVLLTFYQ